MIWLSTTLRLIIYNKMSHDECILFWSDKNDKSDILDGKYFSRIIDPIARIVNNKGKNHWEIIRGVSDTNKSEIFHSNLICLDNYINKSHSLNPLKILSIIKKRLGFLDSYLNFDLEKAFGKILNEKKITTVVGIELPIELISACKKMGIQNFEIAHGYGYSLDKPPSCLRNRIKNSFPSNLIVFDKIAYENLASSFCEVKIHFCEHPFLNEIEHWKNKLSQKHKEFLTKIYKSKKRTILCSLNWGYAKDHPEMRRLDDILNNGLIHENLLDLIDDTRQEFNWLIRLHPIHIKNKDKYKTHFELLGKISGKFDNVEWKMASEIPLLILFNFISNHVTMRSETAYDAALFGIKTTFLCPLIGQEGYYTNLVNCGYASLCELKTDKIYNSLKPLMFENRNSFFSKHDILSVLNEGWA